MRASNPRAIRHFHFTSTGLHPRTELSRIQSMITKISVRLERFGPMDCRENHNGKQYCLATIRCNGHHQYWIVTIDYQWWFENPRYQHLNVIAAGELWGSIYGWRCGGKLHIENFQVQNYGCVILLQEHVAPSSLHLQYYTNLEIQHHQTFLLEIALTNYHNLHNYTGTVMKGVL